ncbi:hypothetical protein OS493_005574 [Desmophyllum pertusum]|uniref:Uncharacterized protein n=1 Tax=Desmophyllum pertusum TaxID=174260 RepID=A0A9W9YSM8_9CNID|nr:hypothetical protein OS493_005574 [Desmophyllum pertusum]
MSDEDNAVENCLQRPNDETLEDDLPDVGELDDQPAELNNNDTNNELVVNRKETARIQESEGGDLSDAASDELSNLFPNVTPHSLGSIPVPNFLQQRARFPLTMASVPTPPSLDALDKISLSPASVELDEFNMDTEEMQRKSFGENLLEKDFLVNSGAVSPTVSPRKEPFLMADFLEEEDLKIYTSERKTVKKSPEEEKGLATSDNSSETFITTATKNHIDEAIREEMRNPGCENPNSKDNVDNFETNFRGKENEREVAKKCNTRGVTKDCDARGISHDFVARVGCSRTSEEFNQPNDDDFTEAFFMDVTDDDAFTNITLPGDDNVGGVKTPKVTDTNVMAAKSVYQKLNG